MNVNEKAARSRFAVVTLLLADAVLARAAGAESPV